MCVQTNNWFHVFRDLTDFAEAPTANISGKTKDSYQWNPCYSWTAQTLPKEDAKNHCKNVAVYCSIHGSYVLERRTSTGSERFSLLIYLGANKFVLLRVLTFKERFCPRICSKSRLKSAKSPLLLTCVAQKRRCLNSPLCSMNYSNINSLWGPVSTRIRVFLKTESFFSVSRKYTFDWFE